jgi:L-lysine exporter family protein LysE/ArgO
VNILGPLLEGFVTGMALSLMLGTVFFAILHNSVKYGWKTGMYIATGVIISDVGFILLAAGSTEFAGFLTKWNSEISLAGGLILVGLGLFMIFRRNVNMESQISGSRNKSRVYYAINGFLLNVINPVNFFFWLGISTVLTISFEYSFSQKLLFFFATLLAVFITETLIAWFASRISKWVSPGNLRRLNRITGTVFILAGLRLVIYFFSA